MAYLPQVTTAMISQLGLGTEVQNSLREFSSSGFLVTQIQTEPQLVLQFHPLLREFLRALEQSGISPKSKAAAAGCKVLDDHGHPEEAAALHLRNRDWDSLVDVIPEECRRFLKHGRGQTLQGWIEALPDSYQNGDPWITYWLGATRYPFAPREARQMFAQAYRQFSGMQPIDVNGAVAALSSVIETIINDPNDFKLLDPWIEAGTLWASRLSECRAADLKARITGNMFMAVALRRPQHLDIRMWRERTQELIQSTTDPNVKVSLCAMVIALAAWIGQFARVEPLLDTMRCALKSPGISPVSETKAAQSESMFFMLAGDRERCVDASMRGLEIVSRTGVRIWNDTFLINALCGRWPRETWKAPPAFRDRSNRCRSAIGSSTSFYAPMRPPGSQSCKEMCSLRTAISSSQSAPRPNSGCRSSRSSPASVSRRFFSTGAMSKALCRK